MLLFILFSLFGLYFERSRPLTKGMSGQTIISIISTNLGPFGANSGITVGQSSGIRWYLSIFQKPHRFPGN